MQRKGFPLIHLHDSAGDLFSFSKALELAIDHNEYGAYVDKHTPYELAECGARAFLSRDKMAGVAVWPDGNICSVFKDNRSSTSNAIGELLLTAISVGGTKLDCFDGFLRIIYSKFGFIPVARVKFDRQFAPPNWRSSFGEPDIIFWIHSGDSVEDVVQKIGSYPKFTPKDIEHLPCFESYDQAYQYRDSLLSGNN